MNYFIKNIHINKLFHLNDIDIPIADEKCPHLIITGKNGSGKTVLLNAISDFLNIIKNDKSAEDENLYGRVDVQSDLLGSNTATSQFLNFLPNLKRDEDHWKVVLTEEEFAKRMFEEQ